eukprot:GHRR01021555.1.p1 GENE.GHRR01021555.1~~GHRR01021555.1.p1  ORF type:complete len:156 (+),score=38.71 GHRR01021555.1:1146-1613(+)
MFSSLAGFEYSHHPLSRQNWLIQYRHRAEAVCTSPGTACYRVSLLIPASWFVSCAGMLVGIAGNVLKQNALFPPPKDASTATEEESGRAGRNFVRGALLGVGATFVGVLLFGAPEYLGSALRVKLPSLLQTPGLIVSLKIAGAAISNWIMTSFYY